MSAVRQAVLHPLTLGAVALMLVNDHVLKAAFPGLVTGKLSDAAGLAFLPAIVAFVLGGRGVRSVAVAAVAVGGAFAAVKLSTSACDVYAALLGRLQWLAALPAWLARGVAVPEAAHATVMRDPTDLVTLPFLVVGVVSTQGRAARLRRRESERTAHAPTHCALAQTTHIGPS